MKILLKDCPGHKLICLEEGIDEYTLLAATWAGCIIPCSCARAPDPTCLGGSTEADICACETCIQIPVQDLVLYTHWAKKSPRFFELLESMT